MSEPKKIPNPWAPGYPPEHRLDNVKSAPPEEELEYLRLHMDSLDSMNDEARHEFFEAFQRSRFVVVRANDELSRNFAKLYEFAREFFSQPLDVKKTHSGPFSAGYTQIHFTNQDNKREEEIRDCFQFRREQSETRWPSIEWSETAMKVYDELIEIASKLLRFISIELQIDPEIFESILRKSKTIEDPQLDEISVKGAVEFGRGASVDKGLTNMTFFRSTLTAHST